jgi:hypothetical protein
MTFIALAIAIVVAYKVGRFIEHRSWVADINEQVALHEADLATGTPIGSALAREMGIQL